jgi:bifunctional non-homologous end joining protein LigD
MTHQFIPFELATLVSEPPNGDGWLHEMKLDGYRLECLVAGGRTRLMTRRGLDWTDRFPTVAAAASDLPVRSAILDGEVVVLLPDGRTSFQALQQTFSGRPPGPLVYFVFDLLEHDGKDLRRLPLLDRKERLAGLLRGRGGDQQVIRYSEHVQGQGEKVFTKACKAGLEGIISKRADSHYSSARTRSWLKVKCLHRQEFVIVGFTEPKGSRSGLGALLLGVHNGTSRELSYAGKVGTGFSQDTLEELYDRLEPLERKAAPLSDAPRTGLRGVHWVEPRLVAEVVFTEWTDDGRLRHPSFVGLREDKPASQVRRERPIR